jgi:hypothetical protein
LFIRRHLPKFEGKGDVVMDGSPREQRVGVILENVAQRYVLPLWGVANNFSGIRLENARQKMEKGAFAGTVWSENGHQFAFLKLQVEIAYDLNAGRRRGATGESFRDVPQLDQASRHKYRPYQCGENHE